LAKDVNGLFSKCIKTTSDAVTKAKY